MTKQEFQTYCKENIVILDGATGTNLQKKGMPIGVCPEKWILENKEKFIELQRDFVEAGTNILYAPTFTANRVKLAEYGLREQLEEMNVELVKLSKEAAGGKAYVAGDLTMTGLQLHPIGETYFEELVDIYKEQVAAILKADVDLFVVETMMSLQETRAAVLAIKELCDKPIMTSLTFETDGRTLFGTTPEIACEVLQNLGVDVVGLNCSTGPEAMLPLVEKMKAHAWIPIMAKPNAGLPELDENGDTVYKMEPETFASYGKELVEAGVNVIGGCCGTTPAHLKALTEAVKGCESKAPITEKRRVLTSERELLELPLDGPFRVIGERINPTGKKKLQAELRAGSLDLVRSMAVQQNEDGASILDVNMGLNGINEKQMMLDTIYEVTSTVDLPLCIDSSHVDVIEEALRIYPGRGLINSISLESEKFEKLLPIAKKYGAMFVLLPVSDEGLPKDQEEKRAIIRKIIERAESLGLSKKDVIVDGLVATIGADKEAAKECLKTIAYCKDELGVATVCGLSNISFGLPERPYVNSAFLTMAITAGLTLAIANPSQELLMSIAFATDMLLHKEGSDIRYIERVQRAKEDAPSTGNSKAAQAGEMPLAAMIIEDVKKGNKGAIVDHVKKAVAEGEKPGDIINQYLIPGINEVGKLFEQKIYFLPQLISSATAMKTAVEYLEPFLEGDGDEEKATVIMATVEGDIHDIGKNLVVLMLKNYGYHVIDLGKDVKASTILDTAIEEHAAVIGLSALMTTTMMRMKDVVELAKERNYTGKIIIGGAAVTESFAEEIGADGYSGDAADCVRLVQHLLGES